MTGMIKRGVRIIGIDDGPFERDRRGQVVVAGAVYRGGADFDGLLVTRVRRDGFDATEKLCAMLEGSKFLPQLHYAMLDGIALGGFNVVDVPLLAARTGLKVVVVVRRRPDLDAVRRALTRTTRHEARLETLKRAGEIRAIGRLHCQLCGLDVGEAAELLELTCTRSHLPEPLRAAHLIAGAIVTGQSGRRA
jgi:hypothetical protein